MKMKIALLALLLSMLPLDGLASVSANADLPSVTEVTTEQEFRLPGAPAGGYRGDFRLRVNAKGKGKRVIRKKAPVRRTSPAKKAAPRYLRDDG